MPRVHCPECGASVKVDPEARRVRCPRCDTRFAPEEVAEPPARAREASTFPVLLVVGLVGGALLLVIGGAVGAYLLFGRGGGSGAAAPGRPVTRADLDRVEAYMSLAEVEGVLGKGQQVGYDEIGVMAGGNDPNRTWYAWRNGDDSLVVGFEPGKSGTQRVVVSFFLQKSTQGGGFRQTSTPGVLTIRFPGQDLDQLALDRAAQRKKQESRRWLKGEALRKALVGTWVAIAQGSYQFHEDGTCSGSQVGGKFTGTYRFTEDEHVELTLKDEPLLPGQKIEPRVLKYRAQVDGNELVLTDPRLPNHPTTYQRRK